MTVEWEFNRGVPRCAHVESQREVGHVSYWPKAERPWMAVVYRRHSGRLSIVTYHLTEREAIAVVEVMAEMIN